MGTITLNNWFEMILETPSLLLDWAALLLSWPVVILIIFLVTLGRYGDEIRGVLERIKGIETKYGSIYFAEKEETAKSKDLIPVNLSQSPKNELLVKISNLINQANHASESNQNDKAISILLSANQLLPNDVLILHNLGVMLIRYGKQKGSKEKEVFIQAEIACRQAIYLGEIFPYGTLYNLARAQSLGGNIEGLKETLGMMSRVNLHKNLRDALVHGDSDFQGNADVASLAEYKELIQRLKSD